MLSRLNCFQPFPSQRDFFLWSLKNMSVSFRVKDQSQAASRSSAYSGVAETAVQPAVGVRGGVNARCGPLTLWPPFGKSAQIYLFIYFYLFFYLLTYLIFYIAVFNILIHYSYAYFIFYTAIIIIIIIFLCVCLFLLCVCVCVGGGGGGVWRGVPEN